MSAVGLTNPEEFSFITEEELERPLKKVRSLVQNAITLLTYTVKTEAPHDNFN